MSTRLSPAPVAATPARAPEPPGARRVLVLSTVAFTLMFAAWLMFGVLGIPIQQEFGLTDVQLSWLSAVAILNGSLWRLPAGIVADRLGGRVVFTAMLVATAVFALLVSMAGSYGMLLLLAFLVGFAGNGFSAGIAWNSAWYPRERQGFALGVFGAGNVGASVTKFIGPALIAATAGSTYFGVVEGGWRLVPVLYAVLLLVVAVLLWTLTPRQDRTPGRGRTLRQELVPLRQARVWRFSLYYVAVFGAYVALAAWLPKYYTANFGLSLGVAALLTALFIFPASLLRPLGGWFSDRFGARRVMYWTFGIMLAATFLLSMPNGHIVVQPGDREVLPYELGVVPFTALVFLLGCAMGIGKAAVYKHIPEYFPDEVGSVGGLVGMLGGLGGFFLPPLFAYATGWTGLPSATFFVLFLLTAVCAVWMHRTVVRMLQTHSPELADHFETPRAQEVSAR
ncbi:NarK/NasA family nitrate transporter [Pseudonocardia sp. KRD-184]|uniref:NarK/NasA family nitrate transporter n=1 Tax=Pseudonocardia oceani TaxID=2792013 RepID=A0ABS6UIQ8_9PSEU|nr:MFS transporter [Pseudonocardia oceani]MBW0092473.1 NarK/NasA family nitrate transporter [Pseudonocardia oceani]MBW0098556.1 NarK/NasA family nitrate transporter [Pseudonocardia oceani]MBW0111953.1 NarK/NasA family nitrate transporter [Pseudonocardia oceani]MBW0124095.1 NarK/NasA family nitrate transporter [Pseudonocardia oceani]MBW0131729.1 NarK/NasA family nitrate transporter [Pseudonocardia oceani]